MRLNPIVKKDVKVQARSIRICIEMFAYELILALIFFFAMLIITQENYYSTNNLYSSMVWLYPVLAVAQLCIIGVVVPIRTASAISGEKERQTFDIMMTTSMTPLSIVLGKVMIAMIQSMFFVVASLPIMALVFIVGGMSWGYLFWFFCVALLVSLFAASIGIFCSSICKKSISAVILSYAFYVVFFGATFIPILLAELAQAYNGQLRGTGSYNSMMFLLANPIIYLAEFFTKVMSGESLVRQMIDSTMTQGHTLLGYLTSGDWWLIVSTIVFLVISLLFLLFSAKRVNPIKKRR